MVQVSSNQDTVTFTNFTLLDQFHPNLKCSVACFKLKFTKLDKHLF